MFFENTHHTLAKKETYSDVSVAIKKRFSKNCLKQNFAKVRPFDSNNFLVSQIIKHGRQ